MCGQHSILHSCFSVTLICTLATISTITVARESPNSRGSLRSPPSVNRKGFSSKTLQGGVSPFHSPISTPMHAPEDIHFTPFEATIGNKSDSAKGKKEEKKKDVKKKRTSGSTKTRGSDTLLDSTNSVRSLDSAGSGPAEDGKGARYSSGLGSGFETKIEMSCGQSTSTAPYGNGAHSYSRTQRLIAAAQAAAAVQSDGTAVSPSRSHACVFQRFLLNTATVSSPLNSLSYDHCYCSHTKHDYIILALQTAVRWTPASASGCGAIRK